MSKLATIGLSVFLFLSGCARFPYNETFLVYVHKPPVGSGTAFAIGEHFLLTAGHVCAHENLYIDDELVTVVKVDEDKDLCLLYSETTHEHYLKLASFAPNRGDRLYMLGYPLGLGPIPVDGRAVKYSMLNGQLRYMFSMPAVGGNSGSPVLDSRGFVVSVLVAAVPRNPQISFGVPLEDIRAFLVDVN